MANTLEGSYGQDTRNERQGLRHEAEWANIARMNADQMQSYLRVLGAYQPMSTAEWRARTSD